MTKMRFRTTELSRRGVLRMGGATALAAGLGSGLAGRALAQEAPIAMLGWDFQPDTIQRLVSSWTAAGNPEVDVSIIPNLGYSAALQTRLRGGETIDMYYNFAYNSQRFHDQDWAASLNGLPGVDDMMADMFESARSRHVTPDGTIISVPYFSAVHMLHYNQKMLADAGVDTVPGSLQEIYDASAAIRDAGIAESPYVAYWVKEFCEEYLHTYLLNAGIEAFDEAGEPIFADDPATEGVFEWWQAMYQDGLAPQSLLTDDPGKLSAEMANGNAAFFVLHHYFLTSIRSLEGPSSADVTMAAPSADFTLQIGEVLQMGAGLDEAKRDATWELMKYYGWKDTDGSFTVFKEWAQAAGLAAPYANFFTDPDIVATFPDYYDLDLLSQTFDTGSKVVPARTMPWYPDFQLRVGDIIHMLLLGQETPAGTVSALADAVRSAQRGSSL